MLTIYIILCSSRRLQNATVFRPQPRVLPPTDVRPDADWRRGGVGPTQLTLRDRRQQQQCADATAGRGLALARGADTRRRDATARRHHVKSTDGIGWSEPKYVVDGHQLAVAMDGSKGSVDFHLLKYRLIACNLIY